MIPAIEPSEIGNTERTGLGNPSDRKEIPLTLHPDFQMIPTASTYASGNPATGLHNLASRTSGGITVSLDFKPFGKEISVTVSGADDFTLRDIPHALALDVYRHPYAYAERFLASGRLIPAGYEIGAISDPA